MTVTRLARSAAALALAVSGLAVPATAASLLTAGPASAATCGGGAGVTVVVDRTDLGGATTTGCDRDGGTAADNFADTGAGLTYAQRDPGFVCRVGGAPADDPCVNASPASAYWGLWWSDGKSGDWQYSTLGVGSLMVPAGGSVAFRFHAGDKTPPSAAPPVMVAVASAAEQETTLVDDPVDPQASESDAAAAADGLPVWVAPVLIAGLLLVGGAVAGLRRFRGAPGRP